LDLTWKEDPYLANACNKKQKHITSLLVLLLLLLSLLFSKHLFNLLFNCMTFPS